MESIDIYSGDKVISRVMAEESLAGLEACLEPYAHVFAVMDRAVAVHCPAAAEIADVLNRRNVPGMLMDASECHKTMETVMEICTWLLENGADRDALVLAVGGGITTDMTGFAASIYKRGVRFAYVPTTLLAQVDAAIGGKTGVNFEKYKNILGVIRQPEFTYMCPQVLESLPRRDFLSGAAEMLKTFVIEDGGCYGKAVELLSVMSEEYENGRREASGADVWRETVGRHTRELAELMAAAARVKAGVVSRDQFEKGERRKLNLGHTFAHAIETLAQMDGGERFKGREGQDVMLGVTHGEAVAMGMVLAARLADRYYRYAGSDIAEMEKMIDKSMTDSDIRCHCPYSVQEMADIMRKDKKSEGGKVHFVLPRAVGDVETVELSVEEVVVLMS